VTEVCSAGGCVNRAPPGWIDHWLHNEWGFFNSPVDARLVVPPESGTFTVFAYRLLPVRFVDGVAERLAIDELPVDPLPAPFTSLGFDTLNRHYSAYFECAPLSCNYLAQKVPVNRFCLLGTLEGAIQLAERLLERETRTGTYYVLEVLREGPARRGT
jgi:hypothetical protein